MSWRALRGADLFTFGLTSRYRQPAGYFAPPVRSPYKVLGLTSAATADDIKKSFRALAKSLHPDANQDDPKAAGRFAELHSAYEILGDESKREAFDRGDIDARGNPTGGLFWRATRPSVAVLFGSLLALLMLFYVKTTRTPHILQPVSQLEDEQTDTAGIQPIVNAIVGSPPALQQALPPAVEVAQPRARIDGKQVDLLIQRSQDLISEGDVAAARILLRRAAEADSARAAITLGATYDPVVLATLRAPDIMADISQARLWYTRAIELGSQEAQVRLNLLDTR
jgi:DnaJ domain